MRHDFVSKIYAAGTPAVDEPLEDFSRCHADILDRLQAFSDLPALTAAAARARVVAADVVSLFERTVLAHHADEESELFSAVLRWADKGEEHARVSALVNRLAAEHRTIEGLWKTLRDDVEHAARGRPSDLDEESTTRLVQAYRAHAAFEEQEFLPLAREILARDSNHMASLGVSLHMRHAPRISGYI